MYIKYDANQDVLITLQVVSHSITDWRCIIVCPHDYGAGLVSKLSPPRVPFRGCTLFVGGQPLILRVCFTFWGYTLHLVHCILGAHCICGGLCIWSYTFHLGMLFVFVVQFAFDTLHLVVHFAFEGALCFWWYNYTFSIWWHTFHLRVYMYICILGALCICIYLNCVWWYTFHFGTLCIWVTPCTSLLAAVPCEKWVTFWWMPKRMRKWGGRPFHCPQWSMERLMVKMTQSVPQIESVPQMETAPQMESVHEIQRPPQIQRAPIMQTVPKCKVYPQNVKHTPKNAKCTPKNVKYTPQNMCTSLKI